MSVNSVVLSGRLTRDPELKSVGGDLKVCKFALAVDEFVKGEKRANFFEIVAWGKTAETAAMYLTKGRECAVQGSLKWHSWEGPDGAKRSSVEVVANRVQFFGPPEGDKPRETGAVSVTRTSPAIEEDIPF